MKIMNSKMVEGSSLATEFLSGIAFSFSRDQEGVIHCNPLKMGVNWSKWGKMGCDLFFFWESIARINANGKRRSKNIQKGNEKIGVSAWFFGYFWSKSLVFWIFSINFFLGK